MSQTKVTTDLINTLDASKLTGALPAISGASLTGIEAVTKSATAPVSPADGDQWFNTSASTVSGVETKVLAVYNGTSWHPMSTLTFSATGGTTTTDGVYTIHTFTSSGTFTPNKASTVDMLVVGGGGGTGHTHYHSGGAGGGGVLYGTNVSILGSAYTVTVGAGGAGGTTSGAGGGNPSIAPYNNGGTDDPGRHGDPSSFGSIAIALGGGYGGAHSGTQGGHGGSGGGGPENVAPITAGGNSVQVAPAGFTAYGNSGGTGQAAPNGSGGGGGAGAAGSGPTGGAGISNSISGTATYYAGGGGGASYNNSAIGGAGGVGGGGVGNYSGQGGVGGVNTGGGAGASERNGGAFNGPIGGSGIVIVRYTT